MGRVQRIQGERGRGFLHLQFRPGGHGDYEAACDPWRSAETIHHNLNEMRGSMTPQQRARRRLTKAIQAAGFKPGDQVRHTGFGSQIHHGARGIVKKLNRTRIQVFFDGIGLYVVDPECLEKTGQEARA